MKNIIKDHSFPLTMMYFAGKRDKSFSLSLLVVFIIIIIVKLNTVECMEASGEIANTIAHEIERRNITEAKELLIRLANENLTVANIQALHDLINQELNRNPDNMQVVTKGNIHHVANPGTKTEALRLEPITWRDIALAIGIAIIFVISLYLIYKYWTEIRGLLLSTTRGVFSDVARHLRNPYKELWSHS